MRYLSCALFLLLSLLSPGQVITTIAGNEAATSPGDGGPATVARIRVGRLTIDRTGSIFFTEEFNNRVRKIDTAGIITTIAGTGATGYTGDGGAATNAELQNPKGIAIDSIGNIYIADYMNNVVRKITPDGIITTFAGDGAATHNGDGNAATTASLNHPSGVIADDLGNIYISEVSFVRKVDPMGIITTIAGSSSGCVSDGVPATDARLTMPMGLVFAHSRLYFTDNSCSSIVSINASGIVWRKAGGMGIGYNGENIYATYAWLNGPTGIAIDDNRAILIADEYNHRIRMVDSSGEISTIAGTGEIGHTGDGDKPTLAKLTLPSDVAVDAIGNIYIADAVRIRKINKYTTPAGLPFITALHSDIQLYPNPIQGEFTIAALSSINSVCISDVLGQKVYEHEYNTEKVLLDISHLKGGVYLVKINGTEVRKLIKQW